jgi:ribosomal protein S18 acetylase RimI-like enzyme
VQLTFQPLDSGITRDRFDCGIPELNDYLQKYARQNQLKGIAKTIVALADDSEGTVAGYYAISMAELSNTLLPEADRKKLPRYPIPAVKLAKLAVDRSFQGQGVGRDLLIHVLQKALSLSEEIGVVAVIVDATNEQAKSFYVKYGFVPLPERPLTLFLPIASIAKSFGR